LDIIAIDCEKCFVISLLIVLSEPGCVMASPFLCLTASLVFALKQKFFGNLGRQKIMFMNAALALGIGYVLFLLFSYLIYISSIRLRSELFFVCMLIYFFAIYFLFDELLHVHQYLRDRQIYIELGHADIELMLLMFFCYINSVIILFIILYKRQKIRSNRRV